MRKASPNPALEPKKVSTTNGPLEATAQTCIVSPTGCLMAAAANLQTDAEIRNICKEKLESLEHWLRRLIDETLTPLYGDYFTIVDHKGDRIIKNAISQAVDDRRAKEPFRYPRKIDAVLLDDAVSIICNPQLYKKHFQPALATAFPEGAVEARTFLSRLLIPRNNLAHANAISSRAAEQIVCYSNDVIDSLKKYYREAGMEKQYDCPLILKVSDSFGNALVRSQFNLTGREGYLSFTDKSDYFLSPGDILTLEVEVDPSYDTSSYTVEWSHSRLDLVPGHKIAIPITNQQVGELFEVSCFVKSDRDWHRLNHADDILRVSYKVLPPQK